MNQVDWNIFLPQQPRRVLGAAITCLLTLIGAGWGLFEFGYARGKDIGQGELAAYKAVSVVKIPELTTELLAANKELRESLQVFERNKKLESENASFKNRLAEAAGIRADLESSVNKFERDLQTAAEREDQLRNHIRKLSGESRRFTLKGNEGELLGGGNSIGLADSSGTTALHVTYNNQNILMRAGSTINIDFSDKQCVLTLINLDWKVPSGDFDLACKPK